MRKNILILTVVAALSFGLAAGLGYAWWQSQEGPAIPAGASASGGGAGAYDHTDRRKVVGISSDVFVGRVDGLLSTQGLPLSGPGDEEIPMQQYSVTVEETIKGSLAGEVTINRMLHAEEGSAEKLLDGRHYVFSVVPNEMYDQTDAPLGHDWYTVMILGGDHVLIQGDSHRAELVQSFRRAYADEAHYDPRTGDFTEEE